MPPPAPKLGPVSRTLGTRLQAIRHDRRLTLRALEVKIRALGYVVTSQTISKLEKGRCQSMLWVVEAILLGLGSNFTELEEVGQRPKATTDAPPTYNLQMVGGTA
jgi:transcriptional regulator with XRE-family HTH domain